MPGPLREQLQTKALYRSLSTLYLHLDSSSVLEKMLPNEIIDAERAKQLHSFTQKCARNIRLINTFFKHSGTSDIVLKLCDALDTIPHQQILGRRLLTG